MKVALIGLGMVADTHLAAIRDASHPLRLAGVAGRAPERAHAFADRASRELGYPVSVFGDVATIAQDPGIDFVILATPPDARLEIVRTLTAHRKPILMEKPVERTLEAARKIVDLCADSATPLGIVFQHRARAASQALRQAVQSGVLGDLATVEIRVPWWREQAYYDVPGRGSYARDGGGAMINQAIHTLDLALWILGPVTALQAMMRTTPLHDLEAEDWAGALLEFRNGACGTLMATTSAYPGSGESLAIQGTRAAAHLEAGQLTLSHLDGRVETFGAESATGGGADPMAFTHAWHQSVIEDFVTSLKSGDSPLAPGRSALAAHAVIDAMERSNRWGRRAEVPET